MTKLSLRTLRLLVIVGVALSGAVRTSAAPGDRLTADLLTGWTFHLGDEPAAAAPRFDDGIWDRITLPHTWNALDGQDGGGNYHRGPAWYRRHFRIAADWTGRRIFLEFDGANRIAEVFLNGHRLGEHRGGFTRFRFDATDVLDRTGDNVLAVRVTNAAGDHVVPVSADYTFFGGIYRGVRLVAVAPAHIDLLDHASPGVFVRAMPVTRERADLGVRVELANDERVARQIVTQVAIVDAEGAVVQTLTASTEVAAGGRVEARLQTTLEHPHLWDAQADPYLYSVRTTTLVAGEPTDRVTLPLGLRFFSVDPDRGFLLNGRHLDLHGVNRHQDRPGKGWAISADDEREDFALIREIGATAVRQSHYPQSQLWDELGDAAGMVMWAEVPFVNEVEDDRAFFTNAEEQLRELIRQNAQHPCIFFWSVGNETFVRDPATTPADTNDRLLARLAQVAHAEDDTRLTTYASNGNADEPRAAHTDVVGFNHYAGWYHDTPEAFAPWIDAQHAAHPTLRIGISEYGAGANVTQHEVPPHQPVPTGPWHPEEWQARQHEVYWQAMAQRPWLWGKFVWCMFDFASDGRNEGSTPGRNDKGLVTADRKTRKDAFYWYAANWSDRPVLHVASARFSPRPAGPTTVTVYANASEVELQLDGRSLGRMTSTNRIFRWEGVELTPGEHRIEATGTCDGRALRDACTWIAE